MLTFVWTLTQLTFIDSSGIRELLSAADARRDGWTLEIVKDVSAQVRRVFDLTGASTRLWSDTS
jgi:anti-anti-sigma factor